MTGRTTREPTWTDVLTAAVLPAAVLAAVLAAVVVAEVAAGDGAPSRAVLGVLAVAAVAVARRRPLLAAAWLTAVVVVQALFSTPSDTLGVLLAVVVTAFCAGAFAPVRDAAVAAALMALALAVAVSQDPTDDPSTVPATVALLVLTPAVLGWVHQRRRHEVVALSRRTEELARESEAAVDAERRRIARELHDVVAHAVTLVAVQAEAGQAVIATDPDRAARYLEGIGTASRDALGELARLVHLLREDDPDDGAPPGLALAPVLLAGAERAGLTVTMEAPDALGALPPEVDHAAYRLVQEGLTNALRHAPRSRVRVCLSRDAAALHVVVTSDGERHRSAYGGTGRGLRGLRERVGELGGVMEVTDGGDTFRLAARLPLPAGPA